jgi:SAM-dependent methyltransferase
LGKAFLPKFIQGEIIYKKDESTKWKECERRMKSKDTFLSKLSFKKAFTKSKTHKFLGFKIPLDLLCLTGGGPDTFDETALHHRKLLFKYLDFKSSDLVFELGCGIGRDAIHLATLKPAIGKYVGVDIIEKSISWASLNISKKHPNFRFHHNNVEDQLHNPAGTLQISEVELPLLDKSVDKIFMWSVFTHMSEDTIKHYFTEFQRVLKDDGIAFASCFIVNEEVLDAASKVNLTPYDLKFEFPYGPECFINNLEYPMGAVAYTESKLDQMLEECGLVRTTDFFRRAWSGYWNNPSDGQDGFCFGNKDRLIL